GDGPAPRLTLDLRDGSRLIGECAGLKELTLQTSFGPVRIAAAQLEAVRFTDDKGAAVVRFRNGDRLTGTVDLAAVGDLRLATALGELKVPLGLVAACAVAVPPRRVKVSARASGAGEGTDPHHPFDLDRPA